jgi:hypothetical protein
MRLRLALLAPACLVALLAPAAAHADPPAPLAPTVDAAQAAPAPEPSHTRRNVGIALTAVGGGGLAAGTFLTWFAFSAQASCEAGPCPPAVSDGAKAGAIGGTIAAGALLATGIVLVVTGAKAEEQEARRLGLRPTAQGLAVAF